MDILTDVMLIDTGMLIAILVTTTGVGGGSLMTPALIFGFDMPAATAVGTDLIYVVFTKSGALLSYARVRSVDWSTVGWLLAGSVPAAIVATVLMAVFHGALQERLIQVAVGVALLLTVLSMVIRLGGNDAEPGPTPRPAFLSGAGAIVGALVALTSIGAGALTAALLTRLFPKRPIREIVGADLAHAVPLAAVAAGGHFLLGQVDWRVALFLALGVVPGIWIGRRLVDHVPDKWMRYIMAALLTGVAIKLIV